VFDPEMQTFSQPAGKKGFRPSQAAVVIVTGMGFD
jgi:hypothetical protein